LRASASGSAMAVRENDAAIFTESRAADGSFVHRSFLPKRIDAVTTPDALVASILQAGAVDGRSLAGLDKDNVVVLRKGPEWSASIAPSLVAARDADVAAGRAVAEASYLQALQAHAERRAAEREHMLTLLAVVLAAGALAFLIVLLLRRAAAMIRVVRRWAAALRLPSAATLRPEVVRARR
jgi:hypothetical protein